MVSNSFLLLIIQKVGIFGTFCDTSELVVVRGVVAGVRWAGGVLGDAPEVRGQGQALEAFGLGVTASGHVARARRR